MRIGHRCEGDRPVPGASNMMSRRDFARCVASGRHISTAAPNPLIMSSGGPEPIDATRSNEVDSFTNLTLRSAPTSDPEMGHTSRLSRWRVSHNH